MVVVDWSTIFPILAETTPMAFILAIILGLIRNLTGFIGKLREGNGLDGYDWQRLVGTMVYYFGGVLLFAMGLEVPQAILATVSLDYVVSAAKKVKEA